MVKSIMNIYVMRNVSLQEVYFGLTENDSKEVVKGHKEDLESPVSHWKFDEEKVQWGEVQTGLPEGVAHSFIQALRREPPDEGWVVVVGVD